MNFRTIILSLVAVACGACTKVPAGNVGIMVDLYGSSKGVQAQELGPGRYWVGFNQDLFIFPTFTQTYTWHSEKDGKDESITFQSVEGLPINTDVGITYHVTPEKVPLLFQKYRRGIDEITETYIHNMVRDSFVELGSRQAIETIYGTGKADLVTAVQDRVQKQVADIGLVIEKVYLVGTLRLPTAVGNSINAKIAATQMAQQRENEVAQSKAEAQKEIAKAQGTAQSLLINAEAEAKALALRGAALRDNPGLVSLNAIEKWDGHLPNVNGGSIPFVSIPGQGK